MPVFRCIGENFSVSRQFIQFMLSIALSSLSSFSEIGRWGSSSWKVLGTNEFSSHGDFVCTASLEGLTESLAQTFSLWVYTWTPKHLASTLICLSGGAWHFSTTIVKFREVHTDFSHDFLLHIISLSAWKTNLTILGDFGLLLKGWHSAMFDSLRFVFRWFLNKGRTSDRGFDPYSKLTKIKHSFRENSPTLQLDMTFWYCTILLLF